VDMLLQPRTQSLRSWGPHQEYSSIQTDASPKKKPNDSEFIPPIRLSQQWGPPPFHFFPILISVAYVDIKFIEKKLFIENFL
jgi:hypothetical protein